MRKRNPRLQRDDEGLYRQASEALKQAGAWKGPFPLDYAAAKGIADERNRRIALAAEKMKQQAEQAAADSGES